MIKIPTLAEFVARLPEGYIEANGIDLQKVEARFAGMREFAIKRGVLKPDEEEAPNEP